jgi:putative transposase
VQRAFAPGDLALNRVWVGDISYPRTWEGWSYLATVIDLASRRVVGFALGDHMRTSLILEALRMALKARRPLPGLIFHSDRVGQGEFNWSMQHLVMEVVRHGCYRSSAGDSSDAWPDMVAWWAVHSAA